MAKRAVDDTSLTAVADAIRSKAGTESALSFPDGFVNAVEGIEKPEIYQTKAGALYTPIFSTGDLPFGQYTTSSNLLSYADKLIEATFPNWTGVYSSNTQPISDSSVQRAYFPKLKTTTSYVADNCPNLVDLVFGGIGYAVKSLYSRTLYGSTNNPDLVITVYVDALTLADIPTTVTGSLPGSATNATIIYRNSTTGEVITE